MTTISLLDLTCQFSLRCCSNLTFFTIPNYVYLVLHVTMSKMKHRETPLKNWFVSKIISFRLRTNLFIDHYFKNDVIYASSTRHHHSGKLLRNVGICILQSFDIQHQNDSNLQYIDRKRENILAFPSRRTNNINILGVVGGSGNDTCKM